MDKSNPTMTTNATWLPSIALAVVTIIFGIVALLWPQITLVALAYLFGAFIIARGIIRLITGFISMQNSNTWWLAVILGLLGIGVGLFLIFNVNLTLATFIFLTGFALIAQGILEIGVAINGGNSARASSNTALQWIIGLASFFAGIFILIQPVAGGIAFVWILGLYALIAGFLELVIALQVRKEIRGLGDGI